MLYLSAVDTATLELLKKIMSLNEFDNMRLAGGTALALQIGHRKSIDLDFFGKVDFESLDIADLFSEFESVERIQKTKNINIFSINGIKIDFVNYSYPWLIDEIVVDDLRLAGLKDIMAMKIAAITGRGTKKDFIDFYYLLKYFSFQEAIELYKQKYFDASVILALKSLSYFDDAENDLTPYMLDDFSWDKVKTTILNEVINYS